LVGVAIDPNVETSLPAHFTYQWSCYSPASTGVCVDINDNALVLNNTSISQKILKQTLPTFSIYHFKFIATKSAIAKESLSIVYIMEFDIGELDV